MSPNFLQRKAHVNGPYLAQHGLKIEKSVFFGQQNRGCGSICLRDDPNLALWKFVHADNSRVLSSNRLVVARLVLGIEITPITTKMPTHE
jgi:hypothetical protein